MLDLSRVVRPVCGPNSGSFPPCLPDRHRNSRSPGAPSLPPGQIPPGAPQENLHQGARPRIHEGHRHHQRRSRGLLCRRYLRCPNLPSPLSRRLLPAMQACQVVSRRLAIRPALRSCSALRGWTHAAVHRLQ
ncbi:hypothetical protein B0T16DRAFT_419815 [Cercophora newfieldiana]|uniref:Uncharacterized protein n=1 Tax=Cercophora newfieldiana TaxID=92897 RepID=A0AA39XXK4_9PEZI|nr:hypothetical protein B0T16DRAFT_419815 [Cercophora newfieldiana]